MATTPKTTLSATDQAVINGIRRTINRFRENPFYYFTESDLHASLVKDILDGNSDKFYLQLKGSALRLSLVHLEYPTNFSYSRKEALSDEFLETQENKRQRGNFDLVVLKDTKFRQVTEEKEREHQNAGTQTNIIDLLKGIISKDIAFNEELHSNMNDPVGELIDYAIEVKFFHFNNATQEMFDQVKIDNYKLDKALQDKAKIKPINLIFCYYWNDTKDSNKEWRKKMEDFRKTLKNGGIPTGFTRKKMIPNDVLNVFIEVNVDQAANKNTLKPTCFFHVTSGDQPDWVKALTSGYDF